MNDVHHIPSYDITSHLVYVTDEQDVDLVMVDGSVVFRNGRPLRIDRERVRQAASLLAQTIQRKMKEY